MASEPTPVTRVKVSKVAVWNVNGTLIEDVKEATKETRKLVIEELVNEQKKHFGIDDNVPEWVADNWERIESRVERAMAGT